MCPRLVKSAVRIGLVINKNEKHGLTNVTVILHNYSRTHIDKWELDPALK